MDRHAVLQVENRVGADDEELDDDDEPGWDDLHEDEVEGWDDLNEHEDDDEERPE
jgi:hypothetical protein